MREITYEIDERHDGMQVGAFLRGRGFSRAVLTRLKQGDRLKCNGSHIRTVDTVKTGDVVSVAFDDRSETFPNPDLKADVVYDDDDIVVFDKPANMPVHTSIWHGKDTLANLFAALYPDSYFHSVGRLDKDTSGLVTIAKNKIAACVLMTTGDKRPEKVYYAVTDRGFADSCGTEGEIIAPVAREKDDYMRRTVREDGEYAHTKYRVIRSTGKYCLSEISLVTGRTHQIRVHFAYMGFPLIGDELYGGDTSVLKRQALHCGKLFLRQPVTGAEISLSSPLPEDMESLFDESQKDRS